MKEFADDNIEFDENGRNFSERVENTGGKGAIDPEDVFSFKSYYIGYFYCTKGSHSHHFGFNFVSLSQWDLKK